jgi:hypothetical protein
MSEQRGRYDLTVHDRFLSRLAARLMRPSTRSDDHDLSRVLRLYELQRRNARWS